MHYDHPNSHQPKNIDLQLNLFKVWTKADVQDFYQNIFMGYIDQLSLSQAEIEMQKEIRMTLQLNSEYFHLKKCLDERRSILQVVQNQTQNLNVEDVDDRVFQSVCNGISHLRQANLNTAEQLLRMHSHFLGSRLEVEEFLIFDNLFDQLETDNEVIKSSVINNFIDFDEGYDPFFIKLYENVHRKKTQSPSSKDAIFNKKFDLPISSAYRMMKIRNQILDERSRSPIKTHQPNYLTFSPRQEIHPHLHRQIVSLQTSNPNQFFTDRRQGVSEKTAQNVLPADILELSSIRQSKQKLQNFNKKPIKISPIKQYDYQEDERQFSKFTKSYSSQQKINLIGDQSEHIIKAKYKIKPFEESTSLDIDSISQINVKNKNKKHQQKEIPPKQLFTRNSRESQFGTTPKPQIRRKYQIQKISKYQTHPIQLVQQPLRYPKIKLTAENDQHSNLDEQINYYRKPQRKSHSVGNYQDTIKPNFEKYLPKRISKMQDISISRNTINEKSENYREKPQIIRYDYNPQNNTNNKEFGKIKIFKNQKNVKNLRPIEQSNSSQDEEYESPLQKKNQKSFKQKKEEKKPESKQPKKIMMSQECQTENSKPIKSLVQPKSILKLADNPKQTNLATSSTSPKSKLNTVYQNTDKKLTNQMEGKMNYDPKVSNKKQSLAKESRKVDSDQTLQNQEIQNIKENYQASPIKQQKSFEKEKSQTSINPGRNESSKQKSNERQQNVKKEIRMKVGKMRWEQISSFLSKSGLKKEVDVPKLLSWIQHNQTYLMEFTLNDQTALIALASPLPTYDIVIKLWAPVSSECDQTLSLNLFRKYLDFIEKSSCKKIFYNGASSKEIQSQNFTFKKDQLYEKLRTTQIKQSQRQFKPFFSVFNSNIKFKQENNEKMLYSDEIEQFSKQNYFCPEYISQTNTNIPSSVKALLKFSENLKNFNEVNQILTNQNLDNYEVNNQMMKQIDLVRISWTSVLKAPFIVNDGFFKLVGYVVHDSKHENIICVQTVKNSGRILFGKGFSNIQSFIACIKPDLQSKITFAIKMFTKNLYGRMIKTANKGVGCYGNWEINFAWEDELQGKIKHPIKDCINFSEEGFYVALELEGELMYGFQVNKEDFLY